MGTPVGSRKLSVATAKKTFFKSRRAAVIIAAYYAAAAQVLGDRHTAYSAFQTPIRILENSNNIFL